MGMKIKCTLKEFQLLTARCPMCTFLDIEGGFDKAFNECQVRCALSSFCKYGKDDGNWNIAELVEIVREDNGNA